MQDPPIESTAITTNGKPDRRWRRGLRQGLRTRRLPFKGGKAIEQYRNKYRVAIENELLAQGREVGPAEATTVAAAVLAYEHCMKAGFWLATHHDELDHEQRLNFSREEMRGMAEAAKLLKQLGIDRNPNGRDLWQYVHEGIHDVDTGVHNGSGVQTATEAENASDSVLGDVGGKDAS